MTTFTKNQITQTIENQKMIYELLKLQLLNDPKNESLYIATTNLFKTICILESALNYELSKDAPELPFSIESLKKIEYV